MYNKYTKQFICGFLFFASTFSAHASTITTESSNIFGNTWENTYTISNDTLATNIDEFTIFFDVNLYKNLALIAAPVNWDPLVIQPDPALPDDGFFDALALGTGIVPGDVLGGFIVQFDYLGAGYPRNSQLFDIIDPLTFAVVSSGTTVVTGIPLPAAIWLFGTGIFSLAGIGVFGRRETFKM